MCLQAMRRFRDIATDGRIGAQKHFGVAIFSEQIRDAFIAYLSEIEKNVPEEHWETVAFVHGSDPRKQESSAADTVPSSTPSE